MTKLTCNFCGRGNEEVAHLVAGATAFICDGCIDSAAIVSAARRAVEGEGAVSIGGVSFTLRCESAPGGGCRSVWRRGDGVTLTREQGDMLNRLLLGAPQGSANQKDSTDGR